MQRRRDDGVILGQPARVWTAGALLLGAALTAAITLAHQSALVQAERAQFDRTAERSFDAVASRLNDCGTLVRSVQGAFLASEEITGEEFRNLYANLHPREAFPSLQAMGVARREVRDGREHFITTLVAPLAGNERLHGLDVTTQPANMAALVLSRDTDRPAMSAAFLLVQRIGKLGPTDGVTIRLPVFTPGAPPTNVAERRRRMTGSLVASFRVSNLIHSALPEESRTQLDVRVMDVTAPGGRPRELFRSSATRPATMDMPDSLHFRAVRDIEYGGRTWRMTLDGLPATSDAVLTPLLTLALGSLATLLMATTVWSLANTRTRAARLAADMSAQYRDSESRFRALNELLPTLVLLARASDGLIVYANHAARERLALPDPEQSGKRLIDLFDDPALPAQLDEVAQGGWAMINRTASFHGISRAP